MSHDPWWSSYVAVDYLENLGWKPENEEEKIAYLIAKRDWKECKEMGEVAIKEAIESLAHPIYVFEETPSVLGEIVEAVNSFGKEKVVEILKGVPDGYDNIERLENMIRSPYSPFNL